MKEIDCKDCGTATECSEGTKAVVCSNCVVVRISKLNEKK